VRISGSGNDGREQLDESWTGIGLTLGPTTFGVLVV